MRGSDLLLKLGLGLAGEVSISWGLALISTWQGAVRASPAAALPRILFGVAFNNAKCKLIKQTLHWVLKVLGLFRSVCFLFLEDC